jgi:hypothetical protein
VTVTLLKGAFGQARWVCPNRPFPGCSRQPCKKWTHRAREDDARWREKTKSSAVFRGIASVTSSFWSPPSKTLQFSPLDTSGGGLPSHPLVLTTPGWDSRASASSPLSCPSQQLVSSFSVQGSAGDTLFFFDTNNPPTCVIAEVNHCALQIIVSM